MRLAIVVFAASLLAARIAHAGTPPAADPCATVNHTPARAAVTSDAPRRRIYLVRHGEANYVGSDGKPLSDPDTAGLSDRGREQARTTARWFCEMGVMRFDRVLTSDMPRAAQTARVLLDTMGLGSLQSESAAALREIDPAHESPDVARARILPALEQLLRSERWDTALIVAHTLVDEVILSEALTGSTAMYGRLEQGNGCVNVLDVGPGATEWVVRAINVCPDPTLYRSRQSVQDRLRK
jgi:probable phosphoglycerate mutase